MTECNFTNIPIRPAQGLIRRIVFACCSNRVKGKPNRFNRLDRLDILDQLDRLDTLDRLDRLDRLHRLDRLDRLDRSIRMKVSLELWPSVCMARRRYDEGTCPALPYTPCPLALGPCGPLQRPAACFA